MDEPGKAQSVDKVEKVPVSRRVLIVGGGIAGLEAAVTLASLGCETTLIEQGESLGGYAAELCSVYGSFEDSTKLIDRKIAAIRDNSRVRVLLGAVVRDVKGNVGDFRVRIDGCGDIHDGDFGVIVIATGFDLDTASPVTSCQPNVISCSELERRLAELRAGDGTRRRSPLGIPKNVCFVVEDSGVDSAIHSSSALKNALAVQRLPKRNVFVCCQNVNVAGEGLEKLYRQARAAGVVIFKFDGDKPQIAPTDAGFSVTVRDTSVAVDEQCNGLVELHCDLLVLPERIVPRSNAAFLQNLLRVDPDSAGYFQRNNVRLKPTASNRKGIFFVGGCRGSFNVSDVLTEARATALEVYNWVGQGEVCVSVGRISVDGSKCALCLTCVRSCPHGAVEIAFDKESGDRAARICDIACHACGICVAECPAKAIHVVAADNPQEAAVAAG